MTRCEYCGGVIDVLSRKFKWINKDSDFALHKKCMREVRKKLPKMSEENEKLLQKYQHVDFTTFNKSEFSKFINDCMKNPSIFRQGSANVSKEEKIQTYVHYIEMLKKTDFPDKEKCLKEAIEDLQKLKNNQGTPPSKAGYLMNNRQ